MTIVQVVMHCPQPDAQTWFSDWQLAVHIVTIQQDTKLYCIRTGIASEVVPA